MDFLCVYTDRWKQKKRKVDAIWRPELIIILWGCSYPLAWRVFSKGRVLGWLLIFFLILLNFSTFKMLHLCPLVSIIPDEKSVVICITFVTLCVFFLSDYIPDFFFFSLWFLKIWIRCERCSFILFGMNLASWMYEFILFIKIRNF